MPDVQIKKVLQFEFTQESGLESVRHLLIQSEESNTQSLLTFLLCSDSPMLRD